MPAHAARVLLAADTCVSLGRRIFGKPGSFAEARDMLRALAGRWHDVHTAVVVSVPDGSQHETVVSTAVEFVAFDDAVIAAYWASGEPADKAGAYGIQGAAAAFVEHISRSYSGIMGLPMFETAQLLRRAGFPI